MAHFAELNSDNIVQRIIVVSNADLLDENGVEQEELGVAVCQSVCGGGTWVQTSYNNNFRKKYAGIGDKYDSVANLFYWPIAPYPSWSLNESFDWEAPVPRPSVINEGFYWGWDEESLSWVSVPINGGRE